MAFRHQYYICRNARGKDRLECRAAKCKNCMDHQVNVLDGSSERLTEKAVTKKTNCDDDKVRCRKECLHHLEVCWQRELDWIYVEKSYNDKLRSKGEADKVIPNRCDNCSDPILLETEGGDICE